MAVKEREWPLDTVGTIYIPTQERAVLNAIHKEELIPVRAIIRHALLALIRRDEGLTEAEADLVREWKRQANAHKVDRTPGRKQRPKPIKSGVSLREAEYEEACEYGERHQVDGKKLSFNMLVRLAIHSRYEHLFKKE